MTDKTLYQAIGRYKYNGCWNDIPASCEYFYAYPSNRVCVLKELIAQKRKLSKGQASYITVRKENIREVRD